MQGINQIKVPIRINFYITVVRTDPVGEDKHDSYISALRTKQNQPESLIYISNTFCLFYSSLSGLAVLGVPADIYRYGVTYMFALLIFPLVILVGAMIYIPIFYKLQITSTYEYLSLRFDKRIRIFASILFTIQLLLFLPIVIYIPALALAQATGFNTHLITPLVCSVCIFYTTLGGLKAVVWTDALQFVVMVGSLIVVLIIGIISVGGFGVIFEKSHAGRRLDITFDFNPLTRDTFWTGTVGNFFMFVNHFDINQSFVQKCLALPSFRAVKIALGLAIIGIMTIMGSSMFTGLVMFAKYFKCDPLERGIITSHDQLVPIFVMEEANFIPGLAGLFISGIFSAALSTLSAALNCLAATVYEDFISPFVSKSTSQERVSLYLKLLVVGIGVFSTLCVYIVEKLGSLLALTVSFVGVTAGPLLGLFSVGMLVPMGALSGGISSLIIMFWIVMKAQWYNLNKIITYPILPVSTDGCNTTIAHNINTTMKIYQFSFLDYFMFISMLVLSALIGVYYGIINKQRTGTAYLLGNKQMGIIPISLSLISSAITIAITGIIVLTGLSAFTGLVIFAKYFECDPLKHGAIISHDQLLPLFLMEVANFIPGLAGLFISGVFSAALSTLSAALNCLAATVYEDFISPCVPKNTTEIRIGCYLKMLVVCMGIVLTLFVYIVAQLDGLWPLAFSFAGVTSGPLVGLFSVGMLVPVVNEKGALSGSIISFLVMIWIVMKSQWYHLNKIILNPILPVTTNSCNGTILPSINETTLSAALTCLAATIYEDFISPCVPKNKTKNTTQNRIGCYLKMLVVLMDMVSTLFVYIVAQLDALWPLTFSFAGVTSGPLVSLFSVGMLVPIVNEKGALSGSIISFLVMIWIVMKSQWYHLNKIILNPILPVTTNSCNGTTPPSINET
ncbi:sodium-coupled monocarboxylate transporter [Holotrichia oblita]|uniref:Sodium-coupled monocarboxylate transporter n=1 Tax=Holotrichia oblita TaxID=644536 RepID=A0ACB9TTH1_HOLOL|nr:sodium-coupled monocarboxylate transporter [Holotrichia oblita]